MAHGHSDVVLSPLRALLEGGSMAGMTDGQLLERFATNQDARAETAFAALLARHSPVMYYCVFPSLDYGRYHFDLSVIPKPCFAISRSTSIKSGVPSRMASRATDARAPASRESPSTTIDSSAA
jgi:hypothetical protein